MESRCPICGELVKGELLTKKDSSLLKSGYKFCYSLLVPIPFVGAYIGGKLYDFLSSISNSYYKHICHQCKCHWTDSPENVDIKIAGNNKLFAIFCLDNTFVVGSIENNFYTIQTQSGMDIKTTVVYKQDNYEIHNKYVNGINNDKQSSYGKIYNDGNIYIGEIKNSRPNGWGYTYAKNGYLYYGKWANGKKNGIMLSVSLDGRTNNVEYWQDGVLLN